MPTYRRPYFGLHVDEGQNDQVVVPGLTETRVHGVSGATPEQLLNDPHPMIVTGDNLAAFYRQKRAAPETPNRTIEAYSWSGLNSRAAARALWLLLFPFGMINFAGWMLPRTMKPILKPLARALLRFLGIVATVHYALWAMVISVDLLAVQCGESEHCLQLGWLGWLRTLNGWLDDNLIRRMVVFAAAPLCLLAVLLWLGRRTKARYDDYWRATNCDPNTESKQLVDDIPLRDPRFWQTASFIDAQALFHIAAAISFVGAILALTLANDVLQPGFSRAVFHTYLRELSAGLMVLAGLSVGGALAMGASHGPGDGNRAPHRPWWVSACGIVALASVLIVIVVALVWQLPGRSTGAVPLDVLRNAFRYVLLLELTLVLSLGLLLYCRMTVASFAIGGALYWTLTAPTALLGSSAVWHSVLLLAATATMLLVYAARSPSEDPPDPDKHLHNPFWMFIGVASLSLLTIMSVRRLGSFPWAKGPIILLPILFLLIAFRIQLQRWHDYPPSWQLRGGGPAVVAAVGVITLTLVSSAFIVLFAQRLRAPDPTAPGPILELSPADIGSDINYYDELGWIAAAGVISLVVLLATASVRIYSLWRFRWRSQVKPINDGYNSDPGREGRDDEYDDLSFARKAAKARRWAALVDDADWLLMVGVVAFLSGAVSFIIQLVLGTAPTGVIELIIRYSSQVLAALASVTILAVAKTRTDESLRRSVGILWEVTSFFPRRFHPLCPPCYAERSVPELRHRLVHLTEKGRGALLVAHSQGTLICAAALLTLLDDEECRTRLRRVAWVTHGCMLRRLFGRGYPSFVTKEDLIRLKLALEDPIAPANGDFPEPPGVPHWMNFCRYSDYLGGRVFTKLQLPPPLITADRKDDIIFTDPTRRWRYVGQPEHARKWLHSFDYTDDDEDPRFKQHIAAVVADMHPII